MNINQINIFITSLLLFEPTDRFSVLCKLRDNNQNKNNKIKKNTRTKTNFKTQWIRRSNSNDLTTNKMHLPFWRLLSLLNADLTQKPFGGYNSRSGISDDFYWHRLIQSSFLRPIPIKISLEPLSPNTLFDNRFLLI